MGAIFASAMRSKEDEELRAKIGLDKKGTQVIHDTWQDVKKFGQEEAGIVLFKKVFAAAPQTLRMFEEFRDIPNWQESDNFRHHCKIFMNIVGSAVSLLHDPDNLLGTLEYLGLKHEGFGITQEHFDLMEELWMDTFHEIMGSKFTPEVRDLWTIFYRYMASVIVKNMRDLEKGVAKFAASAKKDENATAAQ
jgi:hemoglobin-like flavoprotein